jgi:hypothetical protein
VPRPQDKNPLLRDFIAHFVLTDDQPAHLAGCEFLELFATAWVFAQLSGGRGEGALMNVALVSMVDRYSIINTSGKEN